MNRILAPAKLTLSLAVTGVRADGYHELRSEMVSLSLSDELTFHEGERGLTLTADPGTRAEALPSDEGSNLITRALAAVGRQASVHVVKRIPLGGGLGGGSTDAAAVLRWAECRDLDVARSLGSDVPFSVAGGRALVEATGEKVTPLPFEARQFLLLVPPFGVNTARVYAAWDELTGADRTREAGFTREADPPGGVVRDAGRDNALTEAALAVEPRLALWRDALRERTGQEPTLAGSGSTWFVEVEATPGPDTPPWVTLGEEQARLIPARTVPAGWDGS
jgi:4-diphosphocytidyl-2-C-methyl-D-erythritol kinase